MPLSETSDPVVRVVLELRAAYRRLTMATIALFAVVVLAFGSALYLRSRDLEHLTSDANRETVRECFRNANQRPEYRRLLRDPTISSALKDLLRATIVNTPTVADCRRLAGELSIRTEE